MSQQNKGADAEKEIIVAGIFIVVVLALIWYFKHEAITSFLFGMRALELRLIGIVSNDAAAAANFIATLNPAKVPLEALKVVMADTGKMTRWLFAPALLVVAIYLYFTSPLERFKKTHTTASLLKQEMALWPEVAPVQGLDLVSGDITKGNWAVSMTEWEFAHKHKLVDVSGKGLDRDVARVVFKKQLGSLWRGPERLPPYAKAVYAVLAMRIAGQNKESLAKARLLASTFATTKSIASLDTTWVDEAITKYGSHPLVQKVISRHAYIFTVFATMLQISRADGVFASSLFVWLRPVDRRLWYTLDSVGRYTFVIECAGIMAHWLAEKELRTRLVLPCIEKAVEGADKAMRDFVEDDSLERMFW